VALWRLYVAAVASLGLYLPYWIWRTARQLRIGDRYRARPVWWALGSSIPIVAAAVLYELNRRATALAGRRGRAAGPALVCLGLLVLFVLTPVSDYVVLLVLLAPLPVLWVQRNLNRAAARRPEVAHPRRSLNVALAVALVVGLPLHGLTLYYLDLPAFKLGLTPRLGPGSTVSGECDLYALTLPSAGWRRVASGTVGDDPSDLELVGPGTDTWAVAYALPAPDSDLEGTVSARRTLILADGTPRSYKEKREFLEGADDFVPVSRATYDILYGAAGPGRYEVVIAEFDTHVVEIIGHTGEPGQYGDELRRLFASFAAKKGRETS
jgi:hypothetical protein